MPSSTPSAPSTGTRLGVDHPLVRAVVGRVRRRTPPRVSTDDLTAAALVGLWKASISYRADLGRPFEVYALFRIRGEVLDELRRQDCLGRKSRKASPAFSLRAIPQNVRSRGTGPAERLELAEEAQAALSVLSARDRDILWRVLALGHTQRAAGRAHGLSESATSGVVKRGLQAVRAKHDRP